MRQITHDHSWVAEGLAAGLITPEQAWNHPNRNIITRSLGDSPDLAVDVFQERIGPGDVILLCTDGLSGLVRDEEMAAVLSGISPREGAEQLVRLANERGGPDNITVTVIEARKRSPCQWEPYPTPLRTPKATKPALRPSPTRGLAAWVGTLARLMRFTFGRGS